MAENCPNSSDNNDSVFLGALLHKLDILVGRELERQRPTCDGIQDVITGGNGRILHYLKTHAGEDIFQRDIEHVFGMTRSAASRTLELMERKGLIERVSVIHDKRLKKLVITDKSLMISHELHRSATRVEALIEKGITPEEKKAVLSALRRMISNLEEEENCLHKEGAESNVKETTEKRA